MRERGGQLSASLARGLASRVGDGWVICGFPLCFSLSLVASCAFALTS